MDEIGLEGDGKVRPRVRTDDHRAADLSMGFVEAIIDDLVLLAGEGAPKPTGAGRSRPVGLSGGVAYDLPVVRAFHRSCLRHGFAPVLHSRVPPGDGGVSIGQAAVAGRRLS